VRDLSKRHQEAPCGAVRSVVLDVVGSNRHPVLDVLNLDSSLASLAPVASHSREVQQPLRATDEWRGAAAEWFGSLGSGKVAVEFHDIQAITGDYVAAANAIITFKGSSADNEELHVLNNRLTWVLRKTPEGAWKVIHEHTSAPVDVGTGKVTLQR
jgi:ketosteroid isomerase-like protein